MKDIKQFPQKVIQKRIKWLKHLMKSCKDSRMQECYQTIYLYLQDYSKEEIAKITGRGLTTIYRYINSYLKFGLKGLRMKQSPNRPTFLNKEQQQKAYNVVANKVPRYVGFFVEMNLTASLLKKWIIQEFDIEYSLRGALNLLHLLGFSYTKTKLHIS